MEKIRRGDGYCTKELDERSTHSFSVFLGLRDRERFDEAVKYEIESVRTPKERLALYAREELTGSNDIALVRTTEPIVFIPGKIMTVSLYLLS